MFNVLAGDKRTNELAYFGGNGDGKTVFVITGDHPVPARHVRISVDGGSDSSRKLRNARSSKSNGGHDSWSREY
jgi:hypothetical protein